MFLSLPFSLPSLLSKKKKLIVTWGLVLIVSILLNYTLLIMLLQLSWFSPFPPFLPAPPYPQASPHHCSCPWVMCISSLAAPFPILYFTSPWLFCNYLFVPLNPLSSSPSNPYSLRQSLHHCSCPWVMCVSSLAAPFPVLCFMSPWLFWNYLFVLLNPLTSSPIPYTLLPPGPWQPSKHCLYPWFCLSSCLSSLFFRFSYW